MKDLNEMQNRATGEIPNTLKYPLSFLKLIGMYLNENVIIFGVIYAMIPFFLIVVAVIQFKSTKGDIFEIINNLEEIAAFGQLGLKVLVLTYRHEDFIRLVDKTKLFWSTKDCDKEFQPDLHSTSLIIMRFQKLFIYAALTAAVFIIISPIFGRAIPIGIWNMEGYALLHGIVFGLQAFALVFCAIFVCSLDGAFLAFCMETASQFKILCNNLDNFNVDNSDSEDLENTQLNKLKINVEYHIFLQRFINEFQNVYSTIILVEYFTSSPMICVEMYAILESPQTQLKVRYLIAFYCQLVQLSFYCIPADFIASEALAVADSTTHCRWYMQDVHTLKTPLVLMIQNSQKSITFTAGGLIIINSPAVLNVLRVAWSVCAIIRGLK